MYFSNWRYWHQITRYITGIIGIKKQDTVLRSFINTANRNDSKIEQKRIVSFVITVIVSQSYM
jgi:hypothetical protein